MSSLFDAVPFGTDNFADNPEPRCPVVLVLDTSGSMAGAPINALNQALVAFRDELLSDPLATKRCEVAVLGFGPIEVKHDFATVDRFVPPLLEARGDTPMGRAVEQALKMVEGRKQNYKDNGIAYYRPWVFLITDGAPTDSIDAAAQAVHSAETAGKLAFFAVGVEGAAMDALSSLSKRAALKLDGLKFRELFQWLSASMRAVSQSSPGEKLPLPPPGWAEV